MPEKNLIDMELYAIIGKQIKTARNLKGISLDTLSELINGEKTKSTLKSMRTVHHELKWICWKKYVIKSD